MNIRIIREVTMNNQSIRQEVEVSNVAGALSAEELSEFIAKVIERASAALGKEDK